MAEQFVETRELVVLVEAYSPPVQPDIEHGLEEPEGGVAGSCGVVEGQEKEVGKVTGPGQASKVPGSLIPEREATCNGRETHTERLQADENAQQEQSPLTECCLDSKAALAAAPDVAPPRPCRSSARVSEKEKRDSENAAAREQGLGGDQDSRDSSSKDRGRKESKGAGKGAKGGTSALVEESTKEAGPNQEMQASGEHREKEEGEQQKQSVSLGRGGGDGGKEAAVGEEASAAEKALSKVVPIDPAGEKTKKAAFWTFEEEESFFSSLRQFGKNFEKIQAKVKSKDKEQVRHYYYRCIKRMNKLLQPGMILDISNPLVVNTAMLRWWQVRVDVKGDITDLHRKPRKHKQFQTAFEKAFSADLQRKSKARQKQAASLAKPPAGDAPQGQAPFAPASGAIASALSLTSQSQYIATLPVQNTAALGLLGSKFGTNDFKPASLPYGVPSALLSSSKKTVEGPPGKGVQLPAMRAKKRVTKKESLGAKARKAIEAAQLAGANRKAALAGKPPSKAVPPQKGAAAGRQPVLGHKSKLGAGQGGKRARTEDKAKTGKAESVAKRAKGREKGAGEVIDDVGTAPDTNLPLTRGPGRPRKAAVDVNKAESGGAMPSLAGLAEAAAHMEELEHAIGGAKERPAQGVTLPVSGGASVRGGAKAEGGETHGESKLMLQLFPCDDETEARVKKAGFVPFLELTLKAKKSLSSIAQHLVSKWSLDKDPSALPSTGAASLAGCTVRLLPNIDPGDAVSKYSWGVADKSVAAAEVFALVGKPEIFRLKYRLLPRNMQESTQQEAQPQKLSAAEEGPWGHPAPAFVASPLRPSTMASPHYHPALRRGPPGPQAPPEMLAGRQYPTSSPRQFIPTPNRGHAAGTGPSPRAFSWAAEAAAGAWEPHAPRYMLVSNNAPLGRGPGSGGGFGDSIGQEGYSTRGAGDVAAPAEGGGWLDEVEGVSISGFLNSEGSRGFTGSPCLAGDRSRSSLGLPSPSLSSFMLSPEQHSAHRTPFRAPADRVPGLVGRPRSRLNAASALLSSITEDRAQPESLPGLEEGAPPPQSGSRQSAEPSAAWVAAEDAVALPLKDLVPSDSFSGLAPILDTFGMAMSSDGFDIQAWDKCGGWASRSSFAASPAKAEGPKHSPSKRPPSREGPKGVALEERPDRDAFEASVDEADQLRVLEGGLQEERETSKARSEPELYWGNSLGGFEDHRPQPLTYASSAADDFLLKAPAQVDIPFGDSLLLRALESSNDGFLPSTREASGKPARWGSARRASFGRSKSSGDLTSQPEGKRSAESGSTEQQPMPSSLGEEQRPGSARERREGQGLTGRSHSASPEDRAQVAGPQPSRTVPRSRSATPPAGGSGAHFRLDKSLLTEEVGGNREPSPSAAPEPARPFVALFPNLPGQLTRDELLPPAPPPSDVASSMPQSVVKGISPSVERLPPEADKQTEERPSKRKAKAKPKADGRSKLQKTDTNGVQVGKRASELSQANKAAAAALNSCFGKSPFARSSWQDAK